MNYSVFSTFFNAIKYKFDYKGALDNWVTFASDISIAVNTSEDETFDAIESYAMERGYPVSLVRTAFDFKTDGLAYGKIENAAMQNCKGDILIQQNGDERWRADPDVMDMLAMRLYANPGLQAYFVPTIDLYGSKDQYLNLGKKWYICKPGNFRGPVNFGFKADGRIDYNKSSSDELTDRSGNLVPTMDLLPDLSIETLREYVKFGMPISYHLGYLNLENRLDRSIWWKDYWTRTTGDENKHPSTMEELAARATKPHGLPLWESRE